MGKSVPSPSNYTGAANQQAAASQQSVNSQTQANRPNINGNFTSQQWTQDANGNWTLNQGFGAASDFMSQLQQQAQGAGPVGTGDDARNQTIDSAYKAATSRLDPQWAQREEQFGSMLANQGIDPNSEAAKAARRDFSNNRNDAYSGAMSAAIREGNAAGSDVFRNNLAAHNNPFAQLMALAGLSTNTPGFNAAGQAQSPDLLAATMGQDSANLRAWQAQQQADADAVSAGGQLLGGLVKTAFMF